MKFKMAEKSLFAVLLRSPWWISFALAGGFALASKALLPPQYVVFGALGGFPFAVIGVIAAWKQFSAPSTAHVEATLAQIAANHGAIFPPQPSRLLCAKATSCSE